MSRKKRKTQKNQETAKAKPLRPLFSLYADSSDSSSSYVPTYQQIKKTFSHAKTLGVPADKADDIYLAMDSCLESNGFYSLVQHAYAMGQPPAGNGFIGYATLSSLSENGFVSACVETVADDMLREWITIEFMQGASIDQDEEKDSLLTEKKEIFTSAIETFHLRELLREATTATRYFGGGLIFIDTGVYESEALRRPLDKTEKSAELSKGKLKGFKFIEPINVFPGSYNSSNPLAPDYFEPQTWWVLGKEVHASRFIKISSGTVPVLLRPSYNFFGIPPAQILWDYVLHFQKDRVAVSRMLSKHSDLIFKTSGLRDALLQPNGVQSLDMRVGVMARNRSNDSVIAIDKDQEDIVKIESSLAGLTDIPRQDLEFICAINRTPAVKLLGISPSGFNATGESDLINYNDHVHTMQEKILFSPIKQALDCIQLHSFGTIDPLLTFTFCSLSDDDKQSENTRRNANTTTLATLLTTEIVTPTGARAMIRNKPDDYLPGLVEGLNADEEELENLGDGEGISYFNSIGGSNGE